MEILWLGFYQAILYFSINSKWQVCKHQQKSTTKAVYCGATQLQQRVLPLKLMQLFFLLWIIFRKNNEKKTHSPNWAYFCCSFQHDGCNYLTALCKGFSTWGFWFFFFPPPRFWFWFFFGYGRFPQGKQ